MQKSNAPTKLTVVFASGTGAGPVNTVPLTPGSTPGTASYQTGFTSVNMEPIASGGIPPFGADFNGLHKAATTAQIWQQAGYLWPFDSAFASNANIGGYPQGSLLARADGNGYWMNLADNNTANPDTGGAGWTAVRANLGLNTINMVPGTNAPTLDKLASPVLFLSGALSSAATLQLPLTAGASWIVHNFTTGAGTVSIGGATGGAVTIPQSVSLMVWTEGFNFHAVAAPTTGAYLPIDGTAVAATKLATARNFSITGLATAAAVSFDGTGSVVFNVTALNVAGALGYTPANDASVVHLTGTESISGAKTFTSSSGITVGGLQVWGTLSPLGTSLSLIGFAASRWLQYDITNDNWAFHGGTGLSVTGTLAATGGISGTTGAFSGVLAANGGLTSTTGTFSGAVTCTTMNATSSDRRLKRNIRKVAARPLHRSVKFVSYTMKDSGWSGLGSIAQNVKRYAPEHVGTFKQDGKTYLSLNYAGMAYEQAIWAGQEVDRLTKRIAKLERALDRAKIQPRKRGFVRRMLEAIW